MSGEFLKKINTVYFIGIGGIGMSALAQWFLSEGKVVSGSDREDSPILEKLRKLGVKVFIGHRPENLEKADLVVYTQAINEDNPEIKKTKNLEIPTFSYPQVLGLLSQLYKTIAIAGCHGKTTTTAMLGLILEKAGFDPTIIAGSVMKDFDSNFKKGKSQWLVVEACEYRRAFLNLHPQYLIITNIDNDHLDYYKDMKDINLAFEELVQKVPKDGFVITRELERRFRFNLKFPGEHYQTNAQLAAALAQKLGIDLAVIKQALENYQGTWRRFEKVGETKGLIVIDDYAHHPTEIIATLKAAKGFYPNKKIWCVFQPHLYSRTKMLLKDFAQSFIQADYVIITDIYAAREKNLWNITSKDLLSEIKKYQPACIYIPDFKDIVSFLKENFYKENNLVLTLGAGNINKVAEMLK